MYYYFVSFAHRNGFGNCCISLDKPITTVENIKEIPNSILKQFPSMQDIIVLNYQLLRKEPNTE